jgi:alpha-methylacyl-CoA racemase
VSGDLPLSGVKVLDFSTLLPGPMASLLLAEAGADVVKIERPEGEEMRRALPKFGADALAFALLNRGKKSIAIDLKQPDAISTLTPLLKDADVLLEQFRPGVMERLGLGYRQVKALNPGVVYCSITGYGQTGPKAAVAGHDLNYAAEAGLLSLTTGSDGAPTLPNTLLGDLGGGALPAVVNILMGLLYRRRHGAGLHVDVAMAENLLMFPYSAIGEGFSDGRWPIPGRERLTGGSPRYQIYKTADERYVAAAPLEQRFWLTFCDAIGLSPQWHDDERDPAGCIAEVARIIGGKPSSHWRGVFAGRDVCAVISATLEEATADNHVKARGIFAHYVKSDGLEIPATHVPLDPQFRKPAEAAGYPLLGEHDHLLRLTDRNS